MAILSVREITGREGSEDENFKKTSTRVWQVLTDSTTHTESEILAGSGLPVLFDLHPVFTTAMVVKRRARQSTQESEAHAWEVSLEYSTESRSKTSPEDREQNPTDRPAVLKISFEHMERALYLDLEGDKICNSARDALDPPCVTEETIGVITISRYIASVDYATYMDFNGATNSATYMGFEADTLKIDLEAERVYEQQEYCFKVNATIKHRPFFNVTISPGVTKTFGGWQYKALDAGYRYSDAGSLLHTIVDDEGNAVTKPALLDGGGATQTPTDPPKFAPSDFTVDSKPFFIVTKRRNFSLLNLI